jgi:tripartite-type tricarboxylate transporter receptor subunit TctC
MNPLHRIVLYSVLVLTALGTAGACAQSYPTRPIRLIAPYEPGGGVDIAARLVARELAIAIGQPVTVENRPGAGGAVGTQALAAAAPDGYSLILASTSPIVIAPYLIKNLGYNPQKDLAPVSLISNIPALLLVQPNTPIHSVPELIAAARAQPGKLTFSSSGIGGTAHLAAQLLKVMTGADMLHVPYKGTGPANTALLAGEVTMTFTDVIAGLKFVQSGQLRAVAVTSKARLPILPDVPTVAETLPGYAAGVWYAVFAPAKTPAPIIATLSKALNTAVHSQAMVQTLALQGVSPIGSTPEELTRFIKEEDARWGKVIIASGIKPE